MLQRNVDLARVAADQHFARQGDGPQQLGRRRQGGQGGGAGHHRHQGGRGGGCGVRAGLAHGRGGGEHGPLGLGGRGLEPGTRTDSLPLPDGPRAPAAYGRRWAGRCDTLGCSATEARRSAGPRRERCEIAGASRRCPERARPPSRSGRRRTRRSRAANTASCRPRRTGRGKRVGSRAIPRCGRGTALCEQAAAGFRSPTSGLIMRGA